MSNVSETMDPAHADFTRTTTPIPTSLFPPAPLRHAGAAVRRASVLGMWVFIATEIPMFGGLFCGYAIWRALGPGHFSRCVALTS